MEVCHKTKGMSIGQFQFSQICNIGPEKSLIPFESLRKARVAML